jgi:hypothetical protein
MSNRIPNKLKKESYFYKTNVSKSITFDILVIYAAFCIKKLYNIYMKHFIL